MDPIYPPDSLEVFRKIGYRPFANRGHSYELSTYPYMDIVLHDHCGAKCRFCVAHLIHKRERLPFSPETFQKIDFAIEVMGVREVLLLGGEPTSSPDLFRMIDSLKQRSLNKICMTTNGHKLVKDHGFAERVCASGLTHMNLSLMTLDPVRQAFISGSRIYVSLEDLQRIFRLCQDNGVTLRINTNVFLGNHDSVDSLLGFYEQVRQYCNNIKFSSLLGTDNFSTVNAVTEFNRKHILDDEEYDSLFETVEMRLASSFDVVTNYETLGFVKNSIIMLPTPLVFNYNHGGRLMQMFVEESKIHGVKLLSTGDLSYSWNREAEEFFVDTGC